MGASRVELTGLIFSLQALQCQPPTAPSARRLRRWLVGSLVLRMNPAVLLGAITGAMTSGAALSTVNAVARSSVPALGYTGAYAFATVILTIAGTLIVRL